MIQSLNEANEEVVVNFLQYVQTDAEGKAQEWTWVTDLYLTGCPGFVSVRIVAGAGSASII